MCVSNIYLDVILGPEHRETRNSPVSKHSGSSLFHHFFIHSLIGFVRVLRTYVASYNIGWLEFPMRGDDQTSPLPHCAPFSSSVSVWVFPVNCREVLLCVFSPTLGALFPIFRELHGVQSRLHLKWQFFVVLASNEFLHGEGGWLRRRCWLNFFLNRGLVLCSPRWEIGVGDLTAERNTKELFAENSTQ